MLFCGRSLKLTSTGRVLGFRGQERIRKSNSRDWLDHTCGAARLEPAYGNEAAAALLPSRPGRGQAGDSESLIIYFLLLLT